MDIFTTGYEGENIAQWTEKLSRANITVLIDIRERALSRKKGFSKTALKEQLEKHNIKYVHYRNLGSPGEIRKQLMQDKDYITFFDEYDKYLSGQESTLDEIFELSKEERPCLMCFEKNHRQCHRNSVVKRIEEIYPKKVRIMHL